jgi:hypothetical protein
MNESCWPVPAVRLWLPNVAAPVKIPVANAPPAPSATMPWPLAYVPPKMGPLRMAHWIPPLVTRMKKQSSMPVRVSVVLPKLALLLWNEPVARMPPEPSEVMERPYSPTLPPAL